MTQNLIENLRAEFSHHISRRKGGPFLPSPETAAEIGKFGREMETKRLAGTITAEEIEQGRRLEELQEKITRFNADTAASDLTPSQSPPSLREEEKGTAEPVIIPQISSEEADKIVATINEQFEEKVMKKIRPRPQAALPPNSERSDDERGTDLQDYLQVIKAERPGVPFADEDSQMDLAKLVSKNR